jgi:hypothetical protein
MPGASDKSVKLTPCWFCSYCFDQDRLGKYGCPNCEGSEINEPETRNFNMHKYDREKGRPFEVGHVISEMGRSRIEVTCPFCDALFYAYIWSISGGGKKCPGCGAMHTRRRVAYPEIKKGGK